MCTECTRVYVQQTLHVARCMRLEFYLQFTFGGNALYAHLNQNADFNDDVKVFVFFFFCFYAASTRQAARRARLRLGLPNEGRKYCAIAHPAGAKIAPTGVKWSCGMQQPTSQVNGVHGATATTTQIMQ